MADKVIQVYTKGEGRAQEEKLRAALVAKFGEAKIGRIYISRDGQQLSIEADLTAAQWTAVQNKLDAKGFKPDDDFDFS